MQAVSPKTLCRRCRAAGAQRSFRSRTTEAATLRSSSLRAFVLCGMMVLATACFLAGRIAWESKGAGKKVEISVAQAAQISSGGSSQNYAGNASNQDVDQRIQQLLDRYGDVQCNDFNTQQQAQEVFDLDQILFGDALDSDVNGIACDE